MNIFKVLVKFIIISLYYFFIVGPSFSEATSADIQPACNQITIRKMLQESLGIIGSSPALITTLNRAVRAAESTVRVLITGKSGSGKEHIAQLIHHASNRKDKPFIILNASSLAEEQLEVELFGAERGSYTGSRQTRSGKFELANGGTLFLDEIGSISANMQVKLLRILENKPYYRVGGETELVADVRIVTATNENLQQKVVEGTFREDLYYRLAEMPIRVPSLSERGADITALVAYFFYKYISQYQKNLSLNYEARQILESYSWPGQIRQLKSVIHTLVITAEGNSITSSAVIEEIQMSDSTFSMTPQASLNEPISIPPQITTRQEQERETILQALRSTRWNKKEAAKLLGIGRSTLYRKLRSLNIEF